MKGNGAWPQGALPPSGPVPETTRRWVHCGLDADYYDDEVALAAPGELIEGVNSFLMTSVGEAHVKNVLSASRRLHSASSCHEPPTRYFATNQDVPYARSDPALHLHGLDICIQIVLACVGLLCACKCLQLKCRPQPESSAPSNSFSGDQVYSSTCVSAKPTT